jgi:putative DNA primase/helicase
MSAACSPDPHALPPGDLPRPRKVDLPPEMVSAQRWILWVAARRDDRTTKIPKTVDKHARLVNARVNHPEDWLDWETALYWAQKFRAGMGFVLGDGFTGLDFDNVYSHERGEFIDPLVPELIRILDSYSEFSVSRLGVHIICRGTLPPGGRRKGCYELYDRDRYFCVTGDVLHPAGVMERTEQLRLVHERIFGAEQPAERVISLPPPPPAAKGATHDDGRNEDAWEAAARADLNDDDRELLDRIRRSKNGALFEALWTASPEIIGPGKKYPSKSEADLALANMLAYWTGGDALRTFKIISKSKLWRDKWQRRDYRVRTLDLALTSARERRAREEHGIPLPDDAELWQPRPTDLLSPTCTDSGNATRLASMFGDRLHYCFKQRSWYIWDGVRWAQDEQGMPQELAKRAAEALLQAAGTIEGDTEEAEEKRNTIRRWALRSLNAERLNGTLRCLTSVPGIPVRASDFDSNPMDLCVLNGVVDLSTGRLRPHDPEDLHTKLAPVIYDPSAKSELWERFLLEAADGDEELIDFLQRSIGYSATGRTDEETLFIIHGDAAAGKSTFLESIKSVLGDYARTLDFESLLARPASGSPRNDIAMLQGRRFVTSIEVARGQRLAENLVKQITGNDTICARYLYEEHFEYRPAFHLWLAVNHCPHVSHDDDAIWRRILRIPFTRVVPKEKRDPSLKARLRDPSISGSAILNWIIEGAIKWQQSGLKVPTRVVRATQEYRQQEDPLALFIEDHCVIDPQRSVPVAQFRAAYERWAQERGERHTLSPRRLLEALRPHGVEMTKGTKGQRLYRGIALLEHEAEP